MALITNIELANFLCEGYVDGMEWVPLYRGVTFRLFGSSAAIQMENGHGKTSLVESCLYLMSQDRRLRTAVANRMAPTQNGWTHVRIEFVEKPQDEDILQRDLITLRPEDVPGVSYVIGMAWSRGKEPHFYMYQGLLTDAPCYRQEPARLVLVGNEAFKKSVEQMRGARWDKWRSIKEWLEEIRQFTNIDMLKKNVEFQLAGAGDYSAMINQVTPQNGESYDAAFFRAFIAPELLRDCMGAEGEDDETAFEDTLYKTLKPTVDALLGINKQQNELNDAEAALSKFEPVETKARTAIVANDEYEAELKEVVQDASVVYALAVRTPIPGMPLLPADAHWRADSKLSAVIQSLVIDKRAGVLITDEGLATLIGLSTSRLNELANDRRIEKLVTTSQAIDLTVDIKASLSVSGDIPPGESDRQVIDSTVDVKRGGRRHAINHYSLQAAQALIVAATDLKGAHTDGLSDYVTRAFGIATGEIDTNLYRKSQCELSRGLQKAIVVRDEADKQHRQWTNEYEALIAESREAEENQVAYETFAARASQFLPEHKTAPRAAKEWAQGKLATDQEAATDHNERVVSLTSGYETWKQVNAMYPGQALPEALEILVARREEAVEAGNAAREAMRLACGRRDELQPKYKTENAALHTAEKTHGRLKMLSESMPIFNTLFGDVDPLKQNPQADLADANQGHRDISDRLKVAQAARDKLDGIKPLVKVFHDVFGDADPAGLTPIEDLMAQRGKIAVEEGILTEHQPFIEALSQFQDTYRNETPDHKLEAIEQERSELLGERASIKTRQSEIACELSNLDTYAVADGRVYTAALDALERAKVKFVRLHEVAMKEEGDRREAMLSLFSAALSAPVVETPVEADRATEILEKAKLTVPVFLAKPLQEFMRSGSFEVTGNITHTFLAGRATRQVQILLNPALIAEEKERLNVESKKLTARDAEIGKRLQEIDPSDELVPMVIKARDAIRSDSVKKHAEAEARLDEFSKALPGLQRRVDAMDSIRAMKEFSVLGGETAWQELVAKTIPHEEAELERIAREISRLKRLVEDEATRALLAAKDFAREGGQEALDKVAAEVARLTPLVADLAGQLEALRAEIEGTLANNQRSTADAVADLDRTFALHRRDLETAIAFEGEGALEFMKAADETLVALNTAVAASIARLQDIHFERAQRYIDASRAEGLALAERIAQALGNRDAASRAREVAEGQVRNLSGEIAALQPFIDDLHDAVVEIREQYAKVATFSGDIRDRMLASRAHPDIMEYAEALQLGTLGKLPSTSSETKAAIANLRQSIRELNIDTKALLQRRQSKVVALNAFTEERNRFCQQAREGHIKGLQMTEIERIASATSLGQLVAIHQVKEAINKSIDEWTERVSKSREAMKTNKEASIDTLVRFARQAEINLKILDDVMARTPDARFHVEADVANEETIRSIIESLIIEIEEREKFARERSPVALNKDIERRNKSYKEEIRQQIYANIFSREHVFFMLSAVRQGKTPLTGEKSGGLSTGQRTALMMLWLIKIGEYAVTRAALLSGTRKQQKAALKGAQRLMLFDGLFSNLSNEQYINQAFQGLKDVGENFQLLGFIHSPYYVNNTDIFPVHLVATKRVGVSKDSRRVFVAVEPWQKDNGILMFTSAFKEKRPSEGGLNA
jgi:hypothetical protein